MKILTNKCLLKKSSKDNFRKISIGKHAFKAVTAGGRIKEVFAVSEPIQFDGEDCCFCRLYDITSQFDASKRLHESEEKFHTLLENSRDVIYEFKIREKRYTYVSSSSVELFGIKPEIFIRQKSGVLLGIIVKEDKKRVKEHLRKVFSKRGRGRKSFYIEYRIQNDSNDHKWIADNHTIVYNKQGQPESIIGNITEITFRKNAQEELLKSYELQKGYLELLSSMQDALPANLAMLDKNGNIIAINESWRKFAKDNRLKLVNSAIGCNYLSVCRNAKGEFSDDAHKAARGISKVLRGELKQFQLEYPCHSPEEQRWFRLLVTPIGKTKPTGAVVMHINTTEQKLAELALKRSEEQYKLLFQDNPLPMWIYDFDTLKFINVNDAAIRHYGYSKEEFLKMTLKDIRPKSELRKFLKYQNSSKLDKREFEHRNTGVWKHLKKSGELIDVEITRTSVDFEGKKAVLILAKDITANLKIEEDLKKKNADIELIYRSGKVLSGTLDTEKLLDKIYRIVHENLPCDSMIISSYSSKEKLIKCLAVWHEGIKQDAAKLPPIQLSPKGFGIQSEVIRTGEAKLISNYEYYAKKTKTHYFFKKDGTFFQKRQKGFEFDKSALLAPIKFKGKVIGVIQVLSSEHNAYKPEDMKMLEAFSAQLSGSIANAKLYSQAQNEIKEREIAEEALRRKSAEISVLYEAQKELTKTLDLDSVYDNSYRIISGLMSCDTMMVSSYDKEDNLIRVLNVWTEGFKPSLKELPPIPLAPKGFGIQSEVIRTGESLLISDYDSYFKKSINKYTFNDEKPEKEIKKVYSSALIVPMKIDGAVIGTIQVLSMKKNSFTENDLRMLELLAPHITAATANARLYKQAQNEIRERTKAETRLQERTDEITLLYEAYKDLTRTLDTKTIYRKVYEVIRKVMPCDAMSIISFEKISGDMKFVSLWQDDICHETSMIPMLKYNPENKGILTELINSGEPKIHNHYFSEVQENPGMFTINEVGEISKKIVEDEDAPVTRSAMLAPMKIENSIIGVITVYSYEENAYNEENLKMLEVLTTELSAATLNAMLYQQSQKEIEERIKKENELISIRSNLEEAQRIAHIGSWFYDNETGKISNSDEVYRILGMEPDPAGFGIEQAMSFVHSDDRSQTIKNLQLAITNKRSYVNEDRIVRPNGEIRFAKIMGEPTFDENGVYKGMHGTVQDITEVKLINEELLRSLNEKEMMLKEIHHRVKNNLQVVSSLLRLQSNKITDVSAIEYFKQSEQRVKSMALIHQQLYRTKDLAKIDFGEYLKELCTYLMFAYGVSYQKVSLQIDCDEVYFGIDTALPCGLIVNELVTNSIKHAFPGSRCGVVKVELHKIIGGVNQLSVGDSGIGYKLDFKNANTLGLELVSTLTEQLGGEINIYCREGTKIEIVFPDQN